MTTILRFPVRIVLALRDLVRPPAPVAPEPRPVQTPAKPEPGEPE